MAQAGYLCVNCHNPPWLHYPSMAFHAVSGGAGKGPRHNDPDHGPQGAFQKDFGIEPEGIGDLVKRCFAEGEIEAIADEMAAVELYADPAWEPWMRNDNA